MTLATQNSQDGVNYTGAVSASVITFRLLGGKYRWSTTAADTSQTLSILLPDGTTYQSISALTTAAASTVLDLPPGSYELTFSTATAVEGSLQKIPYSVN
jgi:hypothetical protein